MCADKTIYCMMLPNGVLAPMEGGSYPVLVTVTPGTGGEPATGTIHWNNRVQAFFNYDLTGTFIVSYHITDMTLTASQTQQSVENILPYI